MTVSAGASTSAVNKINILDVGLRENSYSCMDSNQRRMLLKVMKDHE
jgi:hypothetical protein